MVRNIAEESGGVVHLSGANLTFFCERNRAIKTPVELGAVNSSVDKSVYCVTLDSNQANFGGAIYASESTILLEKYSYKCEFGNSKWRWSLPDKK